MARRVAPQGAGRNRRLEERVFDGYSYIIAYKKNGTTHVICKDHATQVCNGKGVIHRNVFTETVGHNHAAIEELHVTNLFFRDLFRATITEMRQIENLYRHFAARYPDAAAFVDKPSVLSRMANWRKNIRPPIPETYRECRDILYSENFQVLRLHAYGSVSIDLKTNVDDEVLATVIYDRELILKLANSTDLHVTSTARNSPENFQETTELIIVSAIYENHAIPCVWTYLTSMDDDAYAAVFEPLTAIIRPDCIHGNFDRNLCAQIELCFPRAEIKQSFYYYCLNLYGVIKERQINIAEDRTLRSAFTKLLALGLLPAGDIVDGFEVIRDSLTPENAQQLQPLLDHVDQVWLHTVTPQYFSAFNDEHRIKDVALMVLKQFENKIDTNRCIWNIFKIKSCQRSHVDLNRADMHDRINVSIKCRSLVQSVLLRRAWRLASGPALNYLERFFRISESLLRYVVSNLIFRDESPPYMQALEPPREVDVDGQGEGVVEEAADQLVELDNGAVVNGRDPAIGAVPVPVDNGRNEEPVVNPPQIINIVPRNVLDDWECIVCRIEMINYACIPCMHIAYCGGCVERLTGMAREAGHPLRCPLCNLIATEFSEVFFPGRR